MKRIWLFLILCCLVASSIASPFVGAGLNTHGQLLPVEKLRAIGIRWVRAELPASLLTQANVQRYLKHYAGFPVLWILLQDAKDPQRDAKRLASWGVTDIEVGNEPEQGIFNPGGRAWQGAEYGRFFAGVRKALGNHGPRLYGPATGTWKSDFTANAIRAGLRPEAFTAHLYWKAIYDMPAVYLECQRLFGRPFINSEVSFMGFPQFPSYPVTCGQLDGILTARLVMGDLAWCGYDGTESAPGVGYFDTGDGGATWTVPTKLYWSVAAATVAN